MLEGFEVFLVDFEGVDLHAQRRQVVGVEALVGPEVDRQSPLLAPERLLDELEIVAVSPHVVRDLVRVVRPHLEGRRDALGAGTALDLAVQEVGPARADGGKPLARLVDVIVDVAVRLAANGSFRHPRV